jgi:hypothetical protein
MKFNRESWIFITGQAGYGKTIWIKEHIKKMPPYACCIYDFNRNDYQEFIKNQNYWPVESGSQHETEQFLSTVYEGGNTTVILDESDNYLLYPSESIRKFVNTARNRGIGAFVNAKRAKAVKPVYRNRFTNLVIFHISIPEDIRYLEEWAGVEKDRLEILRNLEIGEHILIDLNDSTISEVQKPIKITQRR